MDQIIETLISDHPELPVNPGDTFYSYTGNDHDNRDFIERIYDMFCNDCKERDEDPAYYEIVVSGKFGIYFIHRFPGLRALLVNGNLHNEPLMDLSPFADKVNGREFVFFDDALFTGETSRKIDVGLGNYGGNLKYVVVIFTNQKNPAIRALFRIG